VVFLKDAAMIRFVVIALPITGATCASPALAVGEFSSGGWAGKAFFKSADFTHCAMISTQGAWKLLFEINRKGAVRLGVSHKQLKFKKQETKRATLQVDGGPPVTRIFVAALPELVVGSVGSPADAQKLLQSSRLKFQIGDLAADFSLSGAKEAFAQLSICAEKRGAAETSVNAPVLFPGGKRRSRSR